MRNKHNQMLEQSAQSISIFVSLICISLGPIFWNYSKSHQSAPESIPNDGGPQYPPTPKERHWLWKHGIALAGDGVSSHDIIFLQWMQKLKSKVVMFEIPVLGRLIVVGDAALAKHVLQSKSKNGKGSAFPKSPTYSNVVPLIGKKSIVAMEGSEWFHQRRIFNPGFSPDYLKGTVRTIAQKCDRMLECCDKEDITIGNVTDMCSRAIDLTSDVIAQVAFGEDWGYNSVEDNGGIQTLMAFRDLTHMIGDMMRNPINRLNPLFHWRMKQKSNEIDRDMRNLVKRRLAIIQSEKSNNNSTPQKDILSMTLSSVLDENESNRKSKTSKGSGSQFQSLSEMMFTENDMVCMTSQLKTFYFAGHDTTATTIAWAFWLLSMNPEALQKARDEIAEHLGTDWVDAVTKSNNYDNIIPEESTTWENLQKCQYLDAISRETLRLYPPAASTRYQPDLDATFGNYKLGKCIISLNAYAIQRDPDIWGEDADEFRPERFLGEEGRKKISSFGFLPFSKGSRDCIGKYFALLETKMALAALVTRYDGKPVDADQEVYTARLTSVPKNGCLVNLTRRAGAGRSSSTTA